MALVGFEPMTPVFLRTKTVHTLDRAATVIGERRDIGQKKNICWNSTEFKVLVTGFNYLTLEGPMLLMTMMIKKKDAFLPDV
jgi:hypothetical protein